MPVPPPAPHGNTLLTRLGARASSAMLGLGAFSAIVLAAGLLLGAARPAWWKASQGGRGEDRRSLAGAVDNGAWTVVTQIRPMVGGEGPARSEPWSVSLSAEAATAWLNEKLPRWLAAQQHPARLPDGAELQAAFEDGEVHLGVRTAAESEGGRYLSLTLRPRVDREGLWLPVSTASVGRLEIPAGALFSDERRGVLGFSTETAAYLMGRAPVLRNASFRLPDGRRVRLLGFEPEGDRLVLTLQTEASR